MRAPLQLNIKSRDGTLSKDAKLVNLTMDRNAVAKVVKRPSCVRTDLYAPAGQGFGSFVFGDYIYVWTDQNDPTYPAIYDYIPEYWGVGNGAGGGSGGYNIYWENNTQYVEVPSDVFDDIEIGDKISISGVTPSGYNGSCLVVVDKKTAAQLGVGKGDSILITNLSNPGEVIKGGVAKKLKPCSERPAFPLTKPSDLVEYIPPGTPLYATIDATIFGNMTECTEGKYYRTYTVTTRLRANSSVGTTLLTATYGGNEYYNTSSPSGATGSTASGSSISVPSPGASSYDLTTFTINGGTGCGSAIPSVNTSVTTTYTITQSNAVYFASPYGSNKTAWDGMCCP